MLTSPKGQKNHPDFAQYGSSSIRGISVKEEVVIMLIHQKTLPRSGIGSFSNISTINQSIFKKNLSHTQMGSISGAPGCRFDPCGAQWVTGGSSIATAAM